MKSTIRLSQFLGDQDVHFEMILCPPAYTAQNLAKHLHIPGRKVAKSVLLVGPGGYYLAVLPATHHVDLEAVAGVLGIPVRLARDEEIAELFNDCERGTLAPFGRLYGLSTILDESIVSTSCFFFEAQRHSLAIRMRCQDFKESSGLDDFVLRPKRYNISYDRFGTSMDESIQAVIGLRHENSSTWIIFLGKESWGRGKSPGAHVARDGCP